jgi:hypothetical protein
LDLRGTTCRSREDIRGLATQLREPFEHVIRVRHQPRRIFPYGIRLPVRLRGRHTTPPPWRSGMFANMAEKNQRRDSSTTPRDRVLLNPIPKAAPEHARDCDPPLWRSRLHSSPRHSLGPAALPVPAQAAAVKASSWSDQEPCRLPRTRLLRPLPPTCLAPTTVVMRSGHAASFVPSGSPAATHRRRRSLSP